MEPEKQVEKQVDDHDCREITTRLRENIDLPPVDLTADLKLVRGVGPATEQKLKRDGYGTLHDLAEHPRWGERAQNVLESIDSRTIHLEQKVGDREILGLYEQREVVFYDIETMGLRDCPLFLTGLLYTEEDGLVVKQYLARGLDEEGVVLSLLAGTLREYDCIITYNGKRFDIPFTRQRMTRHDVDHCREHAHADLMYAARRQWTLSNYKLSTVEREVLGEERVDDVPSSQVPHIYNKYLREGDLGVLEGVLEHNLDDLVSLAQIVNLL